MLYSMTGYGRAEKTIGGKSYLIELRSLNGKQYDIRLTMPSLLKPYEIEIRNILNEGLMRGSIECIITVSQNGSEKPVKLNKALIKAYYEPVSELSKELDLSQENVLSTLLRMPEVISTSNEVIAEAEWHLFENILKEVIAELNNHRKEEGKSMEDDLLARITNIELQQAAVAALEPQRRVKIKEGLQKVLEENIGKENYDPNRLEQELIYYIEKIDISEEQVRLKNHCTYFKEVLNDNAIIKGKKLSFILQEIGREINTTGSKAYDAEVQKCVVLMKDELEKAKEQILNVL
ncbi:YicC/YloC family endoribonuclease [Parafilimonas terrae]|uniref:TIGR00255 family protein n=1 Tax=Parafilimonas terrae TaxID=1465490 RepID=A0A1I5WIV9_9BACT|nr:YicC/YloC family endoribonuclease [Parafilimonas terrae]SFQ19597.1 TIGR00255 family protein [Parafilimonas terrae]